MVIKDSEIVRQLIVKSQREIGFDKKDGKKFSSLPLVEKRNLMRIITSSESLRLFVLSPNRLEIIDETHKIADREQSFGLTSDIINSSDHYRKIAIIMSEVDFFLDRSSKKLLGIYGFDRDEIIDQYLKDPKIARRTILETLNFWNYQENSSVIGDFFSMFSSGRLLAKIQSIARSRSLSIQYMEGALGTFKIDAGTTLFAKSSDPRPEIPAFEYLSFLGIPAAIVNHEIDGEPYMFRNNLGAIQRYQIQNDIRDYRDNQYEAVAANELHTLANSSEEHGKTRLDLMESFSNLDSFFFNMGSTYCALFLGGFFDRHTKNMWLLKMQDNSFRFGSVDLDTFCCYLADFVNGKISFEEHLKKTTDELYGTFVRLTLQINKYRFNKGEKMLTVNDVIDIAFRNENGPFIKGVAKRASEIPKITEKLRNLVEANDGIPIGVAQRAGTQWIDINKNFNGGPGITEFPDSRLRLTARSKKTTDFTIIEDEPEKHNLESGKTYHLIQERSGEININGKTYLILDGPIQDRRAFVLTLQNGKVYTKRNLDNLPNNKILYLVDVEKARGYENNLVVEIGINSEYVVFEGNLPSELKEAARVIKTNGTIFGNLEALNFANTEDIGALQVIERISNSNMIYWIKLFNEVRKRMIESEEQAIEVCLGSGRNSASYRNFLLMRIPDPKNTDKLIDEETEFGGSRQFEYDVDVLYGILPERYIINDQDKS